ncbi:excinuclease ABC subunit UvrA [Patescibacteria group bacterium]
MKKNGSFIKIRKAGVHNLKKIDVDIPKNKFVVITGLSGSGKSSLAFDTIYAESERRFIESISSYARQFLGVRERPDVESIDGLSPAIAIDQRSISKNPRSTVGTVTEIYDYLRVLFSRAGKQHCPFCLQPAKLQTADEIMKNVFDMTPGVNILILAPVVKDRKGEHKTVLKEIERGGFLRVVINGEILTIEDALKKSIDSRKKHTISVVIDKLVIDKDLEKSRLLESLKLALKMGKGIVFINNGERDILFSENAACPDCGISLPEPEPRLFSFNNPYGACHICTGLGSVLEVDPKLVIPNPSLTLAEGAIQPWARASHKVGRQSWYWWMLEDIASRYNFSLDKPVGKLSKEVINLILFGEEKKDDKARSVFEGVVPNLKRRWKETDSEWTRSEIERYMIQKICKECEGKRLRPEALGIFIEGKSIADICGTSIDDSYKFFETYAKKSLKVYEPLLKEVLSRLKFLKNVGLGYLTLSRSSISLAGGEAQRVRLATQIGSQLTGVIYVLDEPSIGLHMRDHARLLATLKDLRDLGNSIIVVEHDRDTIENADWIIDLGPGAGRLGGDLIFEGQPDKLMRAKTLTSEYMTGRRKVELKKTQTRIKKKNHLILSGASENNLKDIDLNIPLGSFVCVSGVSGSGKSTLVADTLARALMKRFYRAKDQPGVFKNIKGLEYIDKVVVVDQSPIGRTPRSNPATYTGLFNYVRDLFVKTRDAKARGYNAGRFSFNVKGGRCEICEGQGIKKIEMYFLPDIYIECEECRGKRYNKEVLEVKYHDCNIDQILNFSCDEALDFFCDTPVINDKLGTLVNVGLGYMKLGQPATTLSGGEAQRVKLATELAKKATGKTLYILDEPTTGLHFDDVQKLLLVLNALVEKGNTVLVIEHNTDVLKNADWIIDMGPEGGNEGGHIIAEGTPDQVAKNRKSYTGKWIKKTK